MAIVAQLVRALVCGTRGRRFESWDNAEDLGNGCRPTAIFFPLIFEATQARKVVVLSVSRTEMVIYKYESGLWTIQ